MTVPGLDPAIQEPHGQNKVPGPFAS